MKSPADRGPASSDGLLHHRHCDKCKDQRNMIKRQECNEMNHPQSWWSWWREWLQHRQRSKWKVLTVSFWQNHIATSSEEYWTRRPWYSDERKLKKKCLEVPMLGGDRNLYWKAIYYCSSGEEPWKTRKKRKIEGGCHFSEANVIFCRKKRLKSLYF